MILSLVALVLAGILSFGGINPVSTGPSQLVFWFFALLVVSSVVGRLYRSDETRHPFMQRWLDWEELKACSEKSSYPRAFVSASDHHSPAHADEPANRPR